MKIAIIGRTEILYETVHLLIDNGHQVSLIITSMEAIEYTKTANDFELLASNISAKYLYTSKLDTENNIDFIKECGDIDIGVSMNFSSVISQMVIDLFPMGILNAHGGDLPRYRGNACQAWAIINGENKIGLCIHKMIGGELDSGDIVEKEYLDIDINTKITKCYKWMNQKIPYMFLSAIKKLQKNPHYILKQQSKNPQDALRCYPRIPEDGQIDWIKSNIEILRLINASNKPYGGAYCFYQNKKIIIWDAEIFIDNEVYLSEAGQVSRINQDGTIIVICGEGKIKINEIEYEQFIGIPNEKIKIYRKRLS